MRMDWTDLHGAAAKMRVLTEMADEDDEQDPLVKEEILKAPARDGYELEMRVFRSKKASTSPGPLIVLWHGGGWCIGSPTMVADMARSFVKTLGAVVVAPRYRLAPENPWPTSTNDAWDGFLWISKYAKGLLRADPEKGFIIGGVSAGASMAISFAHLARDMKHEPKVTGVFSNCGSARPADPEMLEEKYRERLLSRSQPECVNNPVLSTEMTNWMTACCKPDTKDKIYSSMQWPGEDGRKGLPRVYQQLCGRDTNRDEGLIWGDMLTRDGVETRLDLYIGLPHCFWLSLSHLPEFRRWKEDTIEGFRWLLR